MQLLGERLVVAEVAAIHTLELVEVEDRSSVVLVPEEGHQGSLGFEDWFGEEFGVFEVSSGQVVRHPVISVSCADSEQT